MDRLGLRSMDVRLPAHKDWCIHRFLDSWGRRKTLLVKAREIRLRGGTMHRIERSPYAKPELRHGTDSW